MEGQNMTDTARLIEVVMTAPAERRDAILAAALGASKPRPGTIRQAAEIGACNIRTIGRYADSGLLHPIRITPRRVRYDLNEVEKLFTLGADAVLRKGG
jgi:hypothetical protein